MHNAYIIRKLCKTNDNKKLGVGREILNFAIDNQIMFLNFYEFETSE